MILATVGWGVWFVHALLGRLESDLQPSVEVTGVLGAAFGVPGLLLAVLTLRAKRSWVLFVSAPLFANACLLLAPLIAGGEGGAN